MTLAKMAAIIDAYAAAFEAAGNVEAAGRLSALAASLKRNGKMDVAMLSKVLATQR